MGTRDAPGGEVTGLGLFLLFVVILIWLGYVVAYSGVISSQ